MTVAKKNIYQRLANAREAFHKLELVKTGHNKFAGYKYFELGDFLIPAMDCLRNEELIPLVSFNIEEASMMLYDMTSEQTLSITSPMRDANLKGCHPIQNLGAVETYQRRYLWTILMELSEHDALDSSEPLKPEAPKKAPPKKVAAKKPAPPKEPSKPKSLKGVAPDGDFTVTIENEVDAKTMADAMMVFAEEDYNDSMDSLITFWKQNTEIIEFLSTNYPDHFSNLKATFATIKSTFK